MKIFKPLISQTSQFSNIISLDNLISDRLKNTYVEHPDDIKYQNVEKSIIKEGLQNPIIIRKLDMVVITGNKRCWFAKKHGYSHISADFVND